MKRFVLVAFLAFSFVAFAGRTIEKWNVEARQKFAEQRFGIFIHWGIYANYAQGEWYQQYSALDTATYGRMMDGFYPSKFDAKEWVRVFKAAGAKYVTITSRHHDGFSLWPTAVDDGFNIANTPFKRDILGELAKACKEEGLQLNFYYSLMDWHRTDYPVGRESKRVFGDQTGNYDSYLKFMKNQITELIARYQPGVIWFDGEWDHAERRSDGTFSRTLDWRIDELYDLIHAKRTLVANNNHQPIRANEDIQLFERDLPGENKSGLSKGQTIASDRPVEQCDVIQENVWGYRIAETRFRTPIQVVEMVARAAAKDSNLLMNIGPDGSGCLPAKAVEVLEAAGQWFARNGESIYGTEAGPITIGHNVVSTKRGDVIYLHLLGGEGGRISFDLDADIVEAKYLESGRPVLYERTGTGAVTIAVERFGYEYDLVIRLKVAGGHLARRNWAAERMAAKEFADSTGNVLKYRLYEPKNLKAGEKAPLVVFLHGAGERGDDNISQLYHSVPQILKYVDDHHLNAFILAGQVPMKHYPSDEQGTKWVQVPWNLTDTCPPMPEKPSASMASLIELVAKMTSDPRVDASRVYVTGISMGGYGTWDFILRRPDLVAAAMPVCAGVDESCVARAKTVPIRIFHGGSDTVVPVVRGRRSFAAAQKAGLDVDYTEYPGVGHNSWEIVYADERNLDWLFSNQLKK